MLIQLVMLSSARIFAVITLILIVGSAPWSYAQDRPSGKSFATRSEVLARNGMVATNHPLATQIGIEILKKGGSAVDAAIAANAFLGLADPGMNGIGGDLFAIVWDANDKKLYGLNASGKSAMGMTIDHLKAAKAEGQSILTGPLSVTTPGCVDGWAELHDRFGKLEFAQLLAPTIQYAKEGVPITQEPATWFKGMEASVQSENNPTFKQLYLTNGKFPRKGEIFKNPDLANTLQIISDKGRDGFYKGEVAERITRHIQKGGGYLSKKDLANHSSKWVEPVSVNYRGYDVWEIPPNGQGISALQILQILEGFDMASMGFGSAEHIHHFVEAKKLAYEDLAKYYGDPDFGAVPVTELLSDSYAARRRALIDSEKVGEYHPGLTSGDHTIYLTTADSQGNMVSFIQSISYFFGSMEVPEGLGFTLQNRGGSGFVLDEGHISVYEPGKRPFHTIIPAFITKDGNPLVSFGVMGGDMQPQGHVQIVLNLIDFGMNLQEAGDAPRIRHSGSSLQGGHQTGAGTTYLESGFAYDTISKLMDKGHSIGMTKGIYGGYQAIMLRNDVYYGASESRKDGHASGY
ncbi:MAG: gamma-glutamyltransferase [Cyclobacteriaceae bacterium]|nr:MAG: gamma-glutamyltransferase [Cyclobacteriaceae bacterium]